jgi:hypothetical protein
MKNLKYILGCLFILITLASCVSSRPTVVQDKNTAIIETVHDTVIKIEKDSSSLKALLECQNGKVVLKNIVDSEPGRTLKSPKVQIDNNVLKVDCELPAQKVVVHYKNTLKTVTLETTKTLYVNILTFWQQLQIWGFRLFAALILLFIVWVYIKSKL